MLISDSLSSSSWYWYPQTGRGPTEVPAGHSSYGVVVQHLPNQIPPPPFTDFFISRNFSNLSHGVKSRAGAVSASHRPTFKFSLSTACTVRVTHAVVRAALASVRIRLIILRVSIPCTMPKESDAQPQHDSSARSKLCGPGRKGKLVLLLSICASRELLGSEG